jgi:hypothetical protein
VTKETVAKLVLKVTKETVAKLVPEVHRVKPVLQALVV